MQRAEIANQLLDLPLIEFGLVTHDPLFLTSIVARIQQTSQIPEMLASMEEIDNLNGAGKMQIGEIPNPFGSIADDDFLFGAAPATITGFPIDAFAKFFGGLDGARVGGRIRIADGISFFVPATLSCSPLPRCWSRNL